ncbi:hypothetical protein ROSINTL182_05021 [Roseburia intestinalis L1-82]|uniref:Uncharacterized protein n=1 Tax=Roseburia intestinalis L1-82 TaxID=536231 RepID=C7G564_9FIRM|nr:hypothetical protein ROSINTL182_05021 [Roseburia intestinalis L1-82]
MKKYSFVKKQGVKRPYCRMECVIEPLRRKQKQSPSHFRRVRYRTWR